MGVVGVGVECCNQSIGFALYVTFISRGWIKKNVRRRRKFSVSRMRNKTPMARVKK